MIRIEPLRQCWDEVIENARKHWNETEQFQRGEDFNPDQNRYFQYEDMGIYLQFTMRDQDKLVGHCGMYIMPSMHTQNLIATEDTWFLLPEYRKGRNAIKLYNFVEMVMKGKGVTEINMTAKTANNAGRIMEYLGYTLTAYQYSKHLEQTAPLTKGKENVRSIATATT